MCQDVQKHMRPSLRAKFPDFEKDLSGYIQCRNLDTLPAAKEKILAWNSAYLKTWTAVECQFVEAHVQNYRNFGIRSTQAVEATNAGIKRVIPKRSSLRTIAIQVESLMREQIHKIRADAHQDQHFICQSSPLLSSLNGVISSWGMTLLQKQETLIDEANNEKYQVDITCHPCSCTCPSYIQFILPCRHILKALGEIHQTLRPKHIHTFWIVTDASSPK